MNAMWALSWCGFSRVLQARLLLYVFPDTNVLVPNISFDSG